MNREEAVIYLMRNPKRKCRFIKASDGADFNDEIYIENGRIVQLSGLNFRIYTKNDKSEFEVVRELKEMCFGEALVEARNKKTLLYSIVAEFSYSPNFKDIIFTEDCVILGKWTVKGVYEDD